MAGKKRSTKFVRSGNREGFHYFFLDGDLHKKIHINNPTDTLTAWNYTQHKRAVYSYSQVRKHGERCYTLKEAGELINRKKRSMKKALEQGHVEKPQKTYSLNGREYKYLLSGEDVLKFWAYFATVHFGRPRKDGLATPHNLPSEREVRAKLRQQPIFYVETVDGRHVPSWEATL